MKRIVGTFTLLFITSLIFAVPVALSFETWNSTTITAPAASVGVSVGVLPRVEVQGALFSSFTPQVGDRLGGVGTLTIALVNPHYFRDATRAPLYFNALLGVGYLGGWNKGEGKPFGEIFLKVTPLSLGASYYRSRERTFGFGVGYDHYSHAWSFIVNIFGFDRYL